MPKGVEWNKQVAIELIKAGYFSLAKKHHPDHGGTHDKFLILGATKDHLESLLNGAARQESKKEEPPPKRPYKHRSPEYPDEDRPPNIIKYAFGWWSIDRVEVIRESEKAIMVRDLDAGLLGADPFWLPKSQLHRSANEVWELGDIGAIIFSEWIAKQKGWV